MYRLLILLLIGFTIISCEQRRNQKIKDHSSLSNYSPYHYNVAFLIMEGVYNTELTAPYDVFQHTKFRDGIKAMNTFTVANTHEAITSFEGLRILPDFNYLTDSIPPVDILVVPSAEHHLDTDLEDQEMINWVAYAGSKAQYITSHCDGAFVLAEAGLLDGLRTTTFPSDIDAYRNRYPHLEVVEGVSFVHDGRAITSAGGARSFDAALYLCELLYGIEITQQIAQGLVIDYQSQVDENQSIGGASSQPLSLFSTPTNTISEVDQEMSINLENEENRYLRLLHQMILVL